jgi:hypothetical protein
MKFLFSLVAVVCFSSFSFAKEQMGDPSASPQAQIYAYAKAFVDANHAKIVEQFRLLGEEITIEYLKEHHIYVCYSQITGQDLETAKLYSPMALYDCFASQTIDFFRGKHANYRVIPSHSHVGFNFLIPQATQNYDQFGNFTNCHYAIEFWTLRRGEDPNEWRGVTFVNIATGIEVLKVETLIPKPPTFSPLARDGQCK